MKQLSLAVSLMLSCLGVTSTWADTPKPVGKFALNDELPELREYFKKNGWVHLQTRLGNSDEPIIALIVRDPNNSDKKITLSAEEFKLLGKATCLQYLDLKEVNLTDEGLGEICQNSNLEHIDISSDLITDAGIKHLTRCKELRGVFIRNANKVTDVGLKQFAALPKLKALHLGLMKFDGTFLATLGKSPTLESVNFQFIEGLSDAGVKHLGSLPNLNRLELQLVFLGQKTFTSVGLKSIIEKRLPAHFEVDRKLMDDEVFKLLVKQGWLYGPSVSGATKKKPATALEVTSIDLTSSQVTDRGFEAILDCVNTQMLYLGNSKITGTSLEKLGIFTKLRKVYLERQPLTPAGFRVLAKTPIQELHISSCVLTEDDLKSMSEMSSLKTIYLHATKIKGAWLTHLSKLPKLQELSLVDAGEIIDADATILAGFPALQQLSVVRGAFTDRALTELLKVPSIQRINVYGTNITNEAIEQAKKNYPKIAVSK